VATVASYRNALASLMKYLDEIDRELLECSLDDFSKYIIWLENKGLRSGTRGLYVTSLKTMWSWLRKQGMVTLDESMIPTPRVASDRRSYPFLEPHEFTALLGAFDEFYPKELRNKTIIAFLYATGVRLGELLSLNVDDLNLERMVAVVRTFKRHDHKREIYWDEETNRLLGKWLETRAHVLRTQGSGCEALWVSMDTSRPPARLERHCVQKLFRALRKQLGMDKPLSPHSCRHGFGYRGVRNDVNLRYLQVAMGHANLKNTMVYMGYKEKEVEDECRAKLLPEVGTLLTECREKNTMFMYASTRKNRSKFEHSPPIRKRPFLQRNSQDSGPSRKNRLGHYSTRPRTEEEKSVVMTGV